MIFNFLSKSFGRVARLACGSVLAFGLVSCGGGGGSPGTVSGSSGSVGASALTLTFSSTQLLATTDVASGVTVTAIAKDASNNGVSGVTVKFTSDSGEIILGKTSVTDSTGMVTAILSTGGNTTPRNIIVTATGGGQTATGTVAVIGSAITSPTISVLFSSPTLPSAGFASTAVTVTAVLVDQNNNALSGVPVTFTSDSGIIVVTQATTDANGHATATLNTNGNQADRAINVTVNGDGVTAKGVINVTGTTLTSTSAPASLTVNTPAKFIFNLQDSSGANIPNAAVTFSSAAGNPFVGLTSSGGTTTTPVTDSSGNVTLSVAPTVAGTDTLTVKADGATSTSTFTTSSQSLAVVLSDNSTSPATVLNVSPQPKVEYTGSSCIQIDAQYKVNGVGASGNALVSSSLGTLYTDSGCTIAATYNTSTGKPAPSAGTTARFTAGAMTTLYLSSVTIGAATVTISETNDAGVAGPTQTAVVNFTAKLLPSSNLTLNAAPSVIGPNNNSANPTAQYSVLTATVRDGTTENNLVAGVPVQFSVVADSSGGYLSQSVVYTQANGQAQTNYYSGPVSTRQNGVSLEAVVQLPSAPNGTGQLNTPISLTVGTQSLFVTLGTGNSLIGLDATTYQQPWAAYVTDSAGHPVANATVTTTLVAASYSKGQLFWNGTFWAFGTGLPTDGWNLALTSQPGPWCLNNDNTNSGVWVTGDLPAIVYPTPYPPNPALAGQPYQHVMPGIPGNVTSGVVTDATGYAKLFVTYPKNHAIWTNVTMTATAATLGTQSTATVNFPLMGIAGDYNVGTVPPPGQISPYGINQCGVAF